MTKKKTRTALWEGDMWLSEQGRAYDAARKKNYDGTFKQFQNDLKNNPKVIPIDIRKFKS